jgi:hypothetical protein
MLFEFLLRKGPPGSVRAGKSRKIEIVGMTLEVINSKIKIPYCLTSKGSG